MAWRLCRFGGRCDTPFWLGVSHVNSQYLVPVLVAQLRKILETLMGTETMKIDRENWYSIDIRDVESALARVQCGADPEAAEYLIRYFWFSNENSELLGRGRKTRLDRAFLSFVLEAFRLRTESKGKKSLEVCFGFKQGRGEYPRKWTLEEELVIAMNVERHRRAGWTRLGAIGEVANYACDGERGDKAVDRIYTKHKSTVEALTDEDISQSLPPDAPPPCPPP